MLCNSVKKFLYDNRLVIFLLLSLFFYTADASAETFGALTKAGDAIFQGLRKIIYPAATIGVACVCIGGMFGSFNWKWLAAILLGVFIIAYAQGVGEIATNADLVGDS